MLATTAITEKKEPLQNCCSAWYADWSTQAKRLRHARVTERVAIWSHQEFWGRVFTNPHRTQISQFAVEALWNMYNDGFRIRGAVTDGGPAFDILSQSVRLDEYMDDWQTLPHIWERVARWAQNREMPWPPEIDLFATGNNKMPTKRYCSRFPDGESTGSFFRWEGGEVAWGNPPFRLLQQVVDRLITLEARGYLLCPKRVTTNWFKIMSRRATATFNIGKDGASFQPAQRREHAGPPSFKSVVFYFDFSG